MVRQRETKWYVFSLDAHTNEVVSHELDGLHNQEAFSLIECDDGEKRQLCEAPNGYPFVAKLLRSKKSLSLSFHVYRSQDKSKPSLWKFPVSAKPTRETLETIGVVRKAMPF